MWGTEPRVDNQLLGIWPWFLHQDNASMFAHFIHVNQSDQVPLSEGADKLQATPPVGGYFLSILGIIPQGSFFYKILCLLLRAIFEVAT